jgi:uncharacterized protein (TIGR03083 family)
MTDTSQSNINFLDHIEADGAALVAAVAGAPDAPVAACPGWTNTELADHLGGIYAMVANLVATSATEFVLPDDGDLPEGAVAGEWLGGQLQRLLEVLRASDPGDAVWTWTDRNDVGFFHRRMAHETLVHRWDAQHGAGVVAPLDRELAHDGIEEYFEVGLRQSMSRPSRTYPSQSLHLHRTDGEGEWMLVADDDTGVRITREHGKGDAAVRGTAGSLLLFVWNRGHHDTEVFGDLAVADAWAAMAP